MFLLVLGRWKKDVPPAINRLNVSSSALETRISQIVPYNAGVGARRIILGLPTRPTDGNQLNPLRFPSSLQVYAVPLHVPSETADGTSAR